MRYSLFTIFMKNIIIALLLISTYSVFAQFNVQTNETFTLADTLRGSLRPERTCIDVTHYYLDIEVFIKSKTISGFVEMTFNVVDNTNKIQLDLYKNMNIDSIIFDNKNCKYIRLYDAIFVDLPNLRSGTKGVIKTYYHGKPTIAKNAPWDGGFVWSKDKSGRPWIGVACEGAGASLWWPCKDHFSDKPDSVTTSITTSDSLSCISNGRMTNKENLVNNRTKYTWKVSYPINLYNVTFYIGDYYLIDEVYKDFKENELKIKYWVLGKKFMVVRLHFKMVPGMLHAFEHYFGQFPFIRDGYALVESPYLGMEHQSAIAYGNNYMRGYLGGRLPADQDFDYIVLHESAHEYWGNRVSADDHSDIWIHEAFATYTESLYLEWIQNYKKAVEYLIYQKQDIQNKRPILGPRNVNYNNFKDSDMYQKGSWMLHSLRNTIANDSTWFKYIKNLYNHFAGKVTNTEEIVSFTNTYFKKDFTPFFQQYLLYPDLPKLQYAVEKSNNGIELFFKWKADVEKFDMPMRIGNGTNFWRIHPTNKWQKLKMPDITIDNFMLDASSFLFEEVKMERKEMKNQ